MTTKIISLSLLIVILTVLFISAATVPETGAVTVYGDEYVTKYFQKDQVMEIDIQIDETDWQEMLENAGEEEFQTATVTVNGDTYPLVQVRPKGNSSLSSVARSDSNRYSFKINFGELIDNQTMAGLTQLNLNNCFSDPSYMREYLSYQIFEEMGVAVPAYAYAAVSVNGEYFGLYLAVESILEPYLERNFGDITGDLYKSLGNTLAYNGDNKSNYKGLEVKSSLKNADWSKLIKMLDVLNNGGDIEQHLDVDSALKYIAVSTALANFDSYLGNFGHNYYLYEQNGVFTILPWDLNMSFGGFSRDFSNIYIDEPTQGSLAGRPLVAKLLENKEYLEAYHNYLEQIAANYLSNGYLETETSRLFELISEYVKTDPTAFYTYEQFKQSISDTIAGAGMGRENQVTGLLELAATMSTTIQKQLSGELPSKNDGKGMGGMSGMNRNRQNQAEGEIPGQQPPGNMERPAEADGALQPGGMPEGIDMEEMEAFRQEIIEAGSLTNELREKAKEMGLPERMLEMPARENKMAPDNMPRGNDPGAGRNAADKQQEQSMNETTLTLSLAASGILLITGIIIALFFKRRSYVKLKPSKN